MKLVLRVGTVLVALAGVACSQDPVDLGDNTPARTGETLSDYAASWDGYLEAFEFPSGSDRLRIVLDEHGDGYVEFGDVPLIPAATNPDVGYPEDYDYDVMNPPSGPIEGFRYTVRGATVEMRRIQLGTESREIYKAWCELQTPELDEVNSTPEEQIYGCLPNTGGGGGNGECFIYDPADPSAQVVVDCGKVALCMFSAACTCTADGCTTPLAETLESSDVRVDAALEAAGEELAGTLLVGSSRVNVRMIRQ